MLARVVVDNPGDLLKKQMYVRVELKSASRAAGCWSRSRRCLRDDENLPFVFVAQPDGSFARRSVTLGERTGDSYEITAGLQRRRADRRRRRHLPSVHADPMSEAPPPDEAPPKRPSIIDRVVAAALAQPFFVALMAIALIGVGVWSLNRLPVDAYPDLSPPMVEVITQWPGHAAEEVERLITVPVELDMNGVPKTAVTRSISLYGLSDVIMTFEDGANNDAARQEVFNRLQGLSLPDGVQPSVSPLSPPSGLIYRYVLQSPDRSPMELKTFEDWVIEPQFKSVPGVADNSGFGGGTMQYQVLLDQTKLAATGLSAAQVVTALGANNANAGGGFYSQGGQFYYVRGEGRVRTPEDIGNVVLTVKNGVPILVKDVGRVTIGIAPRLGEFGFEKQDDAVEGVILLRTGEKTQGVLSGVEAKAKELNSEILPKDVKVVPFYDRKDLTDLTTHVVQQNLLRGMLLVVVVLIFFLYDLRAGLIVATTIPLALLFAFVCLDLQKASANLLSIGAIDFGILVDGAVVMVENIFRQLALREGKPVDIRAVIKAAAAEVDRPIFYAVAVIVAGFLPIYVLTGPSGRLFKPMADTMVFALIGALIVTLTLLPVLCAWFMRRGVRERRNPAFGAIRSAYAKGLDFCLARPRATTLVAALAFAASLLLAPFIGGEFMPQLDEGALWVRATMPYTISFDESAKITPQIRDVLKSFPEVTTVASELGRPDDGTDATGFFNVEFYVGLKPYSQWTGPYHTKAGADRRDQSQAAGLPGHHLQLHAAGRRRRRRGRDRAEERARGEGVRVQPGDAAAEGQGHQGGAGEDARHPRRDAGPRTRPARPRHQGRPRQDRPLRPQRRRHQQRHPDRHRRQRRHPGGATGKAVRPRRPARPEYRDNPEQIGDILVATPGGQQIPLKQFADIKGRRRLVHLPRKQLTLHRRPVLGAGPRPRQRGRRRDQGGEGQRAAAARLPAGLGRRIF